MTHYVVNIKSSANMLLSYTPNVCFRILVYGCPIYFLKLTELYVWYYDGYKVYFL